MNVSPCPLCHSCDAALVFEAREFVLHRRRYAVNRCRGCAHAFVNPAPDEETLEEYYAEAWPLLRDMYPLSPGTPPEAVAESPTEEMKISFLRSQGLLDHPGKVLDIGFGSGGFLLNMSRLGWHGVGLEFTNKVDLLFDPGGRFEVIFGPRALSEIEPEQFDLITLWHVLEHLTDPVEVLRQARRALRPNGQIVVAIPNARGLSARIFGPYWYATAPPWHLQQFGPRSLGLALSEAGILVKAVQGFDPITTRLLWVDSVTELIDAVPAKWYRIALIAGLRVIRKTLALAAPLLLWIERVLGLPGVIVGVGDKNPLLNT